MTVVVLWFWLTCWSWKLINQHSDETVAAGTTATLQVGFSTGFSRSDQDTTQYMKPKCWCVLVCVLVCVCLSALCYDIKSLHFILSDIWSTWILELWSVCEVTVWPPNLHQLIYESMTMFVANLKKFPERFPLHEETAHHKHTLTGFWVQQVVFKHQNQRRSVDQRVRQEKAEMFTFERLRPWKVLHSCIKLTYYLLIFKMVANVSLLFERLITNRLINSANLHLTSSPHMMKDVTLTTLVFLDV